MPDQTDPLLGPQEGSEEADISSNLERGVGNGPGHDFRHLVDTQPEAVIKYGSCNKVVSVTACLQLDDEPVVSAQVP